MEGMLHASLPSDAAVANWNGLHHPLVSSFQDWKPEMPIAGMHDDIIGSSFRMHHLLMPHHHTAATTSGLLLQQPLPPQPQNADHRKFVDVGSGGGRPTTGQQQQQQQVQSSSILIPDSTTTPIGSGTVRESEGDDESGSKRAAVPYPNSFSAPFVGDRRRQSNCDGGSAADSASGKVPHPQPWPTLSSSTRVESQRYRTISSVEDGAGKQINAVRSNNA
jgi:hypothetical protein